MTFSWDIDTYLKPIYYTPWIEFNHGVIFICYKPRVQSGTYFIGYEC